MRRAHLLYWACYALNPLVFLPQFADYAVRLLLPLRTNPRSFRQFSGRQVCVATLVRGLGKTVPLACSQTLLHRSLEKPFELASAGPHLVP